MATPEKPGLDRRTFLKVTGAVAGAVAVGGGAVLAEGAANAKPETPASTSPISEHYSVCALECMHCSLVAEVQDGKIINVKGNPKFPTSPCLRGLSRAQYNYSPDRVLYPMKRVGERGSGKFERISWDEALETITAKITAAKEKSGSKSLLYVGGSGNFAALAMQLPRAFWTYLGGVTPTLGQLCCAAVTEAMNNTVGDRYYEFRDTLDQSRYIISWGNNPAVTNQTYFKYITAAMEKGAKLVVIDPRYSETAAKAHEWIPIKPGTDTALAMGMLNLIIRENRHDREFLTQKTGAPFLLKAGDLVTDAAGKPMVMDAKSGQPVPFDTAGVVPSLSVTGEYETVYDMVVKEVAPLTPEEVERITGVPAGTVVRLAREFSAVKPAAIMQNMSGAQRTEFGTYTVLSQIYLCAFTGNYGFPGAGVNDTGGINQMFKVPSPVAPLKVDPIPGIPVSKLGEYLVEGKPHPIEFMWVGATSMLTQFPNTNKVKQGLMKVPFIVAANNRWTSHLDYADIVLPVTSLWESVDIMAATRSRFVQLMDKGIEPPGEAKSDAWIFGKLAARLGFGEKFDRPDEELANEALKQWNLTVADLRKNGPHYPFPENWVPFKDGVFKTPTKKLQLFVPAWKAKKMSPVIHYYQPKESPEGNPELAGKYPLQLTNRKTHRTVHSSFGGGLPWLNEVVKKEQILWIHPADAGRRGIVDGDRVTVYNDRGQLTVLVEVTRWIKPGVVSLENGWWAKEGGSASILSNDTFEPLSYGHALNSTLVDVRKEA